MNASATPRLDDLQTLTQRYATYSRSAGGLSNVFGAVLVAAAFSIAAFLPLDALSRAALALTPFVWLVSKALLRRLYYQRFGGVVQKVAPELRRQRRWMLGYLIAVSTLIVCTVVWKAGFVALRPGMLGYLPLVAALPFVAWRWFWSVSDFYLGILLFCQAAVVFAGGRYSGAWLLFVFGCAAFAIFAGVREHRDFLRIRDALGLGAGVGAETS
jgi:hypothetical protein